MSTKSLSDAQLVCNYISGDENALSVLINRHQSRLYGFIFSKIQDRDAADDVFQDTFIKVCLLYTSPSPRDGLLSRMPSSA